MSANTADAIDRWHEMMAQGTAEGLHELLAPDCTFGRPLFTRHSEVETLLFFI